MIEHLLSMHETLGSLLRQRFEEAELVKFAACNKNIVFFSPPEAGEVTQWLRSHPALIEVTSPVPSTHYQVTYNLL